MSSSSVPHISRSNAISEIDDKQIHALTDSNSFNVTNSSEIYAKNMGKNVKAFSRLDKLEKSEVRANWGTSSINPIKHFSSLENMIDNVNKTIYIQNSNDTPEQTFKKESEKYNRFKVPLTNNILSKGFPHVFFVRPSCNILTNNGKTLREGLAHSELFSYAFKSSPNLLKELVSSNGSNHDFALALSNSAASFSLSDEYINTDTYGKTYTGYKIAYGKNDIDSKTSGNFTVTFNDDRDLNIYQIHRLWVEYINGVYRGEISPDNSSIINKILDYTGAVYYILTAEDGESIIFWSKYYGVFPTTIPSSQYSWGAGNTITNPQLDITYQYSFKEDFNPYTILEFNYNSAVSANGTNYLPVYDSAIGHSGDTWVGAPFIELVQGTDNYKPYEFKLRFRKD